MTRTSRVLLWCCLVTLCAAGGTFALPQLSYTAPGVCPPTEDRWQFDFAPYVWLGGIKGTVGLRNMTTMVNVSVGDILRHLDSTVALRWSGWKDQSSFYADAFYVKASVGAASRTPSVLQANLTLNELIVETAYGYRLAGTPTRELDAVGGVRTWALTNQLNVTFLNRFSAQVSGTQDWVDPFVGLHYFALTGGRWSVVGQGDIGGFGAGSQLSWQIYGGVKYCCSPTFSLGLRYRELYVDYRHAGFLFDTTTQGPLVTFDFTY